MEDEQRGSLRTAEIVKVGILATLAIGILLWMVLADYIDPATATERKDVVNMFILSVAGVIGSVTAVAAVGNLYISRRNLEQQRELDDRRAQDDALQEYFNQMGELLTTHEVMKTKDEDDPLRLLARAQTLTLLRRLEGPERKKDVALFLDGAGLIYKGNTIVSLTGADLEGVALNGASLDDTDLSGAFLNEASLNEASLNGADLSGAFLARINLSGAYLNETNLSEAFLNDADLSDAVLVGANLSGADLLEADFSGANLSGADLSDAFLSGAKVEDVQLRQARSLAGATLPDGTRHP